MLECLRGDPKLLPASMLLEARQAAIEREDFLAAESIQAEIKEACEIASSPSKAFSSIFQSRSRPIISRVPDGDEESLTVCYSASLSEATPAQAFALLSNPARWPDCMLFSSILDGVKDWQDASGTELEGITFREVAGAPPLFPVQFTWSCTRATDSGSEGGILDFEATNSDVGEARRSIRILAMEDGPGCSVQVETSCSAPSPIFKLMQFVDERFFSFLLSTMLAPEGSPLGGLSAKSAIVWSVLIFGWATSSFGWLASFGLTGGGAMPV